MTFRIEESPDVAYDYMLRGFSDEEDSLDGAIDKWEVMVGFLVEHSDAVVDDGGIKTCPLCVQHWCSGCRDCAVADRSGEGYCANTPYSAWEEYGDLESAKEMLEFLIGLKEGG